MKNSQMSKTYEVKLKEKLELKTADMKRDITLYQQ